MPLFAEPADLIVEAGAIHVMDADRSRAGSLAVRPGWIIATSKDRNGLDALAGPPTRRLADTSLTLLPALSDTHEHLSSPGAWLTSPPTRGTRRPCRWTSCRAGAGAGRRRWTRRLGHEGRLP